MLQELGVFIILESPASFSFSFFIQNLFPLGLTKGCRLLCVLSGVNSSWLEHGPSILLFARGLLVMQILTWTSEAQGLPLLDMAIPDLETSFCLAWNGLRGRKQSLWRLKGRLLLLIGSYIRNCHF